MTIADPIHFSPLRYKIGDDGITAPVGSGDNLVHCTRSRVHIQQQTTAIQVLIDGISESQSLFIGNVPTFAWRFGVTQFRTLLTDFDIDYVKIGTTGFGSSDVFSADFSSGGIVPPFDSYSQSGGVNLSVGSGVLHAGGTAGVAFARFGAGFTHDPLYTEMPIRFHADMIAAGGQSAPFFTQIDVPTNISYDFDAGAWMIAYAETTVTVPYPVSAGTWYTLGVSFLAWA